MSEQPELDLGLPANQIGRVWVGEGEHARTATKAPDPEGVTWRRTHTLERCHICIAEQHARLDGADGSPHVAWPASYIRTEGADRQALCFQHAAPMRHTEGLPPQKPENHG